MDVCRQETLLFLHLEAQIAPLFYQIFTLRQFKYSIFVASGSRVLVNSLVVREATRCSVTSMMQVAEPETNLKKKKKKKNAVDINIV